MLWGWRSPTDVVVEGVRELRSLRFANTASQRRSLAPPVLQGDGGALLSLLSYLLVSPRFSCKNGPELCFTAAVTAAERTHRVQEMPRRPL